MRRWNTTLGHLAKEYGVLQFNV